MREISVPSDTPPRTLENFLKKQFPIGYVRKLLRKNGVRINGRRANADALVRGGDRLQLYLAFEEKPAQDAPSESHQLPIVYEDNSLLVIDKPAGIAVHEGRTVSRKNSILGQLENQLRSRGIRPELVHRLDQDTSGLLLIAKDSATARKLEACFEQRTVDKIYLCLVIGRLPQDEGRIAAPLPGRDGTPTPASSRYRVMQRFSETTLVRVVIDTGRLHQIRLHFAKLGYPVVLDDQHGDFQFNKRFRKEYRLKRQFLHAAELHLTVNGKTHHWKAPLARDLEETLRRLRSPRR